MSSDPSDLNLINNLGFDVSVLALSSPPPLPLLDKGRQTLREALHAWESRHPGREVEYALLGDATGDRRVRAGEARAFAVAVVAGEVFERVRAMCDGGGEGATFSVESPVVEGVVQRAAVVGFVERVVVSRREAKEGGGEGEEEGEKEDSAHGSGEEGEGEDKGVDTKELEIHFIIPPARAREFFSPTGGVEEVRVLDAVGESDREVAEREAAEREVVERREEAKRVKKAAKRRRQRERRRERGNGEGDGGEEIGAEGR